MVEAAMVDRKAEAKERYTANGTSFTRARQRKASSAVAASRRQNRVGGRQLPHSGRQRMCGGSRPAATATPRTACARSRRAHQRERAREAKRAPRLAGLASRSVHEAAAPGTWKPTCTKRDSGGVEEISDTPPLEESGDEESEVVAGEGGGSSSLGGIEYGAGDGLHRGAGGGATSCRRRSVLPDGSEREKPQLLLLGCTWTARAPLARRGGLGPAGTAVWARGTPVAGR